MYDKSMFVNKKQIHFTPYNFAVRIILFYVFNPLLYQKHARQKHSKNAIYFIQCCVNAICCKFFCHVKKHICFILLFKFKQI